jgi:hypothetical protein
MLDILHQFTEDSKSGVYELLSEQESRSTTVGSEKGDGQVHPQPWLATPPGLDRLGLSAPPPEPDVRRREGCPGGEELTVRLAGGWAPGRGQDDLHSAHGVGGGGAVQQLGCPPQQILEKKIALEYNN